MMKQQASTFLKASVSALLFLLVVGLSPFPVLGETCDVGYNNWKMETWKGGLEMKGDSTTCQEKNPAWGCFAAFEAEGWSTGMTRGCMDKAPSPPLTPGTKAPNCAPITYSGKYKKPAMLCVFTPAMSKNATVEAEIVKKFLNDVNWHYSAGSDEEEGKGNGADARARPTMTTPLILIMSTGFILSLSIITISF